MAQFLHVAGSLLLVMLPVQGRGQVFGVMFRAGGRALGSPACAGASMFTAYMVAPDADQRGQCAGHHGRWGPDDGAVRPHLHWSPHGAHRTWAAILVAGAALPGCTDRKWRGGQLAGTWWPCVPVCGATNWTVV